MAVSDPSENHRVFQAFVNQGDVEANSSTVVLQHGPDAQWRILIDDPGLG